MVYPNNPLFKGFKKKMEIGWGAERDAHTSALQEIKKKKREKWVVSVVCLRSEFRKKGGSVLFDGEYVCMCVCMTHVCVCV